MSLRQAVADWIAPNQRAATTPIQFTPVFGNSFRGDLGSAQPTAEVLLAECRGIASSARRAISGRLSSLNLQAKVKRRNTGGEVTLETVTGNPLADILENPHPDFSTSQMLRIWGDWLVTLGEFYSLKIGNQLKVPMDLQPMPPGKTTPVLSQGVVTHYLVTQGDGTQRPVARDCVIRGYFPDPASPHESIGALGPTGIEADAMTFAQQHLRGHYENDAMPRTMLKPGENPQMMLAADKKRFYEDWTKHYHQRLGSRVGLPGILPMNWDVIEMSMQSGADVVPLLTFWRDQIMMAFGVSKSILGMAQVGDRSTAETMAFTFDLHTITPYAKVISDALTRDLAHDFDPSLVVVFEDFVSRDKEFELRKEDMRLKNKVVFINEVREKAGLKTVDYGDEPVGTFAEVPYRPDVAAIALDVDDDDEPVAAPTEPQDDAPTAKPTASGSSGLGIAEDIQKSLLNGAQVSSMVQIVTNVEAGLLPRPSGIAILQTAFGITAAEAGEIMSGAGRSRSLVALTFWDTAQREAAGEPTALALTIWARQVNTEKKFQPPFVAALRKIFKEQRDDVLKNLAALLPRARVSAEEIFNPEDWVDDYVKNVEPIRAATFVAVATDTIADLSDVAFVFKQEVQASVAQQGAQMIQHVLQTTKDDIAVQLLTAVENGESAGQVATRIRSVFSSATKHRARTIARTEIGRATSAAQLEGFEQSGVVEGKRWNHSLAADAREHHLIMDGDEVGSGESFLIPEGDTTMAEDADAPRIALGGGSLSAGNTINCRCFLTPVVG